MSMYQHEAMWMSFLSVDNGSHAVKISVGGINALTGLSQNETVRGKQDYVVVGGRNGQKWLDGISTALNTVRQFVAMPLGAGHTVEGQLTGKEEIGGMQIDVFPQYDSGINQFIFSDASNRDIFSPFKTPRQLGLCPGARFNLWDNHPHLPSMTLKDHNIQNGSTISLILALSGGGGLPTPGAYISGFAPGGNISQKINRDPLPAWAYNTSRGTRFHLTIINAAFFAHLTGLPSPPSPISPQTYLKLNLPWFSLYDEKIPAANNVKASSLLANVKSVGELYRDRSATREGDHQSYKACEFCSYELATLVVLPCKHLFCDDCSNANLCPSCGGPVVDRERIAAPMQIPGQEDGDGIDAMSLDERIIKLMAGAEIGKVSSFILKEHMVAEPSGIHHPEFDDRESRRIMV